MRRFIDATANLSLAVMVAAIALAPSPAFAQKAAEAELHPVDPQSGRISENSVGYLRFTKGKGEHEVNVLVEIRNLTNVQGEEPLMTTSGHAAYRHGLRVRARGDCSDLKAADSRDGVLPDVGVGQSGNATMSMTADGFAMSELPGKSVVLYSGSGNAENRRVIACGVIKED